LVDLAQPPFSALAGMPEEKWTGVSTQSCYGLSYADYQALGSKYGIVAAVPIMSNSGNYIGCITLDLPPGVALQQEELALESLATTADLVRRLLKS
jgi:hypothetical protein